MEGRRKIMRGVFRTLFNHLFNNVWEPPGQFKDGMKEKFINYEPFSPFYGVEEHYCTHAKTIYEYMLSYNVAVPGVSYGWDVETRTVIVKIIPRLLSDGTMYGTIPAFTIFFTFNSGFKKPCVKMKYRLVVHHPHIIPQSWKLTIKKNTKLAWIIKDPTNFITWEGCIINGRYRNIPSNGRR
jgi:hypothetical protein